MGSKKDYQQKLEAQFNELSAKINELLAKIEATTKREYDKHAAELPEKLKAMRAKLKELKNESSEAWSDLRPGLEKAWVDLKESFAKAASRFK